MFKFFFEGMRNIAGNIFASCKQAAARFYRKSREPIELSYFRVWEQMQGQRASLVIYMILGQWLMFVCRFVC